MLNSSPINEEIRDRAWSVDLNTCIDTGGEDPKYGKQLRHKIGKLAAGTLRCLGLKQAPNPLDALAGGERFGVDLSKNIESAAHHRLGPIEHSIPSL